MDYILLGFIIAFVVIIWYLFFRQGSKPADLESKLASERVLRGNLIEKLVPLKFIKDGSRYIDSGILMFIGRPIDYVYINIEDGKQNEIVFIEVKSGDAQLSEREKRLKELVEQKKIRWEMIRV